MTELKVCIGYELNGKTLDIFPASMTAQRDVKPIYEVLDGWSSTEGARSWAELPANAIKYVRRIEELIETGSPSVHEPQREDTILVYDPFAD